MKLPRLFSAWALFVGLGAAAHAATGDEVWGSVELSALSQTILQACPAAAPLKNVVAPTNSVEQRLLDGAQEIAPMERFIAPKAACQALDPQKVHAGIPAVDALQVSTSVTSSQCAFTSLAYRGFITLPSPCPGLGCFGSQYDFTGFTGLFGEGYKDVLRLLFAGVHHNGVKDCNSPVRRALVADYGRLFDGNCGNSAECPSGLRHLYRPADTSTTTKVFLNLMGLPAVQDRPFCNGTTYEDQDPIRTPCHADDRVCSNFDAQDKTNGLLLTSHVPQNLAPEVSYPAEPCRFGVFRLAQSQLLYPGYCLNNRALPCQVNSECGASGPCRAEQCPDGSTPTGGLCLVPNRADPSAPNGARFDCLNSAHNLSPKQSLLADGRVFNTFVYSPAGILLSDSDAKKIVGARYRIRQDSCKEATTDTQTACITSVDSCSLGVSRKAAWPGARAVAVRNIEPSDDNIRKIVTDPANGYPLSQALYINSLVGFDQVVNVKEKALKECYLDPAKLRNLVPPLGLLPLKDGRPACRDFDDLQCNVISCTSNQDCSSANLGQCLGGFCAAPCTNNSACSGGRTCRNGRCEFATNTDACQGTLSFGGRLTVCPEFGLVFVAPTQVGLGGKINVSATATDSDNDPLSFEWTATAGSFEAPAQAITKYTCTDPGPQTLTVTVTDGICEKSRTVNVVCAP